MRYPHTRFLNFAHWMQMSHNGGMITVASSRVHWRGSLLINVFKRSSSNPVERLSLISKRPSLKRENHFFLPCSLRWQLSPYAVQIFLVTSAAFAPLLNSKRRICQKCSNFSTWHSIFKRPCLHPTFFKWKKLQYVNSSTTTELQIKNDYPSINP